MLSQLNYDPEVLCHQLGAFHRCQFLLYFYEIVYGGMNGDHEIWHEDQIDPKVPMIN